MQQNERATGSTGRTISSVLQKHLGLHTVSMHLMQASWRQLVTLADYMIISKLMLTMQTKQLASGPKFRKAIAG